MPKLDEFLQLNLFYREGLSPMGAQPAQGLISPSILDSRPRTG